MQTGDHSYSDSCKYMQSGDHSYSDSCKDMQKTHIIIVIKIVICKQLIQSWLLRYFPTHKDNFSLKLYIILDHMSRMISSVFTSP